ncbi:hypothetical protein H4F24_02385 [Vibrio alginolyticus]|uniref:hypothetical protein n=1 Tax=Vibrio harveyi group TaxID=717610 RepID=UPI00094117BD|nr:MULTISPECIES: hypothetical protein [Vibrio harveyi group]MCG6221321.1 hypothetical protein [Vibrio diabolicus]MCG6243920.1 hypothetical protein [Vibrio diabolicus]MCZ5985600.1 hypothetical protein [Vibrio parahaemolyticus]OKQ18008.1 hypothetical protein H058_13950 [Vibrio antiquarius]
MTVRLREPFFSIYNDLLSDEKITLNEFVASIKQRDPGYKEVDEKELRKIACRQINRLKKEKLLLQLSPERDQNPEFIKILSNDKQAIQLFGCRNNPMPSEKSDNSVELEKLFDHMQTQIDFLEARKTELVGEAEVYKNLSECFPRIQNVIGERTKKVSFETAKLNGMLNAFMFTIETLRSKPNGSDW